MISSQYLSNKMNYMKINHFLKKRMSLFLIISYLIFETRINGRLKNGVTAEEAEAGIQQVIDRILAEGIPEQELVKVKNKAESTHVFGEVSVLNKAMNLAFGELLGDIEMVNTEITKLQAVSAADILREAQQILREDNCSTLYYLKAQ